MFDQQVKGQWSYLSIEGSLLQTDLPGPLSRLEQLKKYPIYLLEISNQKIGIILESFINSLPPRNRVTLSSSFSKWKLCYKMRFTPGKVKSESPLG